MAEMRSAYRILIGKHVRKRLFQTASRSSEGDIKIDLKDMSVGAWTGFIWLWMRTSGGGGLL
jgi:hypothetical protein